METDSHSSTTSDYEHIKTIESSVDVQTRKPTKNGASEADSMPTCCLLNNVNWLTTTANSIVEKMRSEFRVEIGAVKYENKLLLAKLSAVEEKMKVTADELETISAVKTENKMLAAKVDSLQAQNSELMTRLEVVELEAKQLAKKQQMAKTVRAKVADRLKNKMQEDQQKFTDEQPAEKDKKMETKLLGKIGKQLDVNSSTKMRTLGSQIHNSLWSNNLWNDNISFAGKELVRMSTNGLSVTKATQNIFYANVRAQLPASLGMLASLPLRGDLPIVYYEVQQQFTSVSNPPYSIGWSSNPETSALDCKWIGNQPGSYGISWDGDYWPSKSYADSFNNNYVVGSGVFMRDGRLTLFFTKNGQLNEKKNIFPGKPIPLESSQQGQLLLYPAVSLSRKDASVEANFGADPGNKPFQFDINAHKAQLWLN